MPARKMALGLARETAPQEIGDNEAENPVTKPFETLIAARPARHTGHIRMGYGFGEKFRVSETMADCLGKFGE